MAETGIAAELVGIEGNPVPEGAVCGIIRSADGIRLRFARWRASGGARKGTICLLHGRTEFIEKYFEVVEDLRRRGFAVATFDWRGQGGSERPLRDGRRGHVRDFREYDRDLEAFMGQVALPDCPPPFYALAHSTGGLIAFRAAARSSIRFERIVAAAPLLALGPTPLPKPLVGFLAGAAGLLGLGRRRIPGQEMFAVDRMPFAGNQVTSDPVRYGRWAAVAKAAPHLVVGAPTFGWLRAAGRATRAARRDRFAAAIATPVLIVAAGRDIVVSTAAIEAFAGRLRTGARVVVPGARHELMMERDVYREQFWAAFDAFVPGSASPLFSG